MFFEAAASAPNSLRPKQKDHSNQPFDWTDLSLFPRHKTGGPEQCAIIYYEAPKRAYALNQGYGYVCAPCTTAA